ncbi:unnamed protein product [Echinostoma caproni]|uniref:BHLH domain-containing protein n=1 Tax=Echinostoma caproni TaxID=27848 RepID=A0A183B099_9TREM|nr:unnamed protein product [Echinostoma caproni]
MPRQFDGEMHCGRTVEGERIETSAHGIGSTHDNRVPPTTRIKPRRPRATMRERQRMAQVNQAFDNLRRVVPRGHMTEYQRLSKIATLRLAIQYIRAMNRILGKSHTFNSERAQQRNKHKEQTTAWTKAATARNWGTSSTQTTARPTEHASSKTGYVNGSGSTAVSDTDDQMRKLHWFDFETVEQKTLVLFGYTSDLGWDPTDEYLSSSADLSSIREDKPEQGYIHQTQQVEQRIGYDTEEAPYILRKAERNTEQIPENLHSQNSLMLNDREFSYVPFNLDYAQQQQASFVTTQGLYAHEYGTNQSTDYLSGIGMRNDWCNDGSLPM